MPKEKKSKDQKKKTERSRSKSREKKASTRSTSSKSKSKDIPPESTPPPETSASGGPTLANPSTSIDFEAGRFFERADTRGTLDQDEFQRLWRAARSGEPLQPPTKAPPPQEQRQLRQVGGESSDGPGHHHSLPAPLPSDLPLPPDFDAGARFERFDSNHDGFISRPEFDALLLEWQRERPQQFAHHLALSSQLFDQFDTNHDGHLSRGEFVQLVRTTEGHDHAASGPQTAPPHPQDRLRHLGLSGTNDHGAPTLAASPHRPAAQRSPSPIVGYHHPSSRGGTEYEPWSTYHRGGHHPMDRSSPAVSAFGMAAMPSARYTHFDETIGVPVASAGADAAQSAGHKVVPLGEAHVSRVAKLQEQVAVMLLPKRAKLAELGATLRRRMEEVQSARATIERESVMDCEAILERLRAAESVKLASLTQNANEIDAELEAIDRLARHIDSSSSSSSSSGSAESSAAMLRLVQTYSDLVGAVERVASRSLPQLHSMEGDASDLTDFPRETKKRTDALAREKKYEEALAVKDRMLWEVVQGHKRLEQKLGEEKALCEEYSEEMGSWLELTDRLSKEVNQLREFAAHTRSMEPEFEALLKERQEMKEQIQRLKLKEADYAEVIEENFALRQQLSHMSQMMTRPQHTADDDHDEPSRFADPLRSLEEPRPDGTPHS